MKIDLGKVVLHGWETHRDVGLYTFDNQRLDVCIESPALKSQTNRVLTFSLHPSGSEQSDLEDALLGRMSARLILELTDPCTRCGSISHEGACDASNEVVSAYSRGVSDGIAKEKRAR